MKILLLENDDKWFWLLLLNKMRNLILNTKFLYKKIANYYTFWDIVSKVTFEVMKGMTTYWRKLQEWKKHTAKLLTYLDRILKNNLILLLNKKDENWFTELNNWWDWDNKEITFEDKLIDKNEIIESKEDDEKKYDIFWFYKFKYFSNNKKIINNTVKTSNWITILLQNNWLFLLNQKYDFKIIDDSFSYFLLNLEKKVEIKEWNNNTKNLNLFIDAILNFVKNNKKNDLNKLEIIYKQKYLFNLIDIFQKEYINFLKWWFFNFIYLKNFNSNNKILNLNFELFFRNHILWKEADADEKIKYLKKYFYLSFNQYDIKNNFITLFTKIFWINFNLFKTIIKDIFDNNLEDASESEIKDFILKDFNQNIKDYKKTNNLNKKNKIEKLIKSLNKSFILYKNLIYTTLLRINEIYWYYFILNLNKDILKEIYIFLNKNLNKIKNIKELNDEENMLFLLNYNDILLKWNVKINEIYNEYIDFLNNYINEKKLDKKSELINEITKVKQNINNWNEILKEISKKYINLIEWDNKKINFNNEIFLKETKETFTSYRKLLKYLENVDNIKDIYNIIYENNVILNN